MIRASIRGCIASVTLSHAPVNAISGAWLTQFEQQLDALVSRGDWHVLHICSSEKVFCAGADLRLMQQHLLESEGPDTLLAFVAHIQRLYRRIEALQQVTVAEIAGAALGGGLELALACDLRIAADEARLGLPEARLGLLPGAGGTQRLSRLCGRSVASRLILGAEVVDGATAAALGIVHWAVPRAELPERVRELLERLAAIPAPALAACKQCVAAAADAGRGGYLDELEHTRQLFSDPEVRRRLAAFLAHKSP